MRKKDVTSSSRCIRGGEKLGIDVLILILIFAYRMVPRRVVVLTENRQAILISKKSLDILEMLLISTYNNRLNRINFAKRIFKKLAVFQPQKLKYLLE